MDKVEIDPTLRRIIDIYRWLGVWRNEGESEFRSSCFRILHYFFNYFSFLIYILTGVYDAYLRKDMNQMIFLVEVEITAVIVLVKLVYLLWRKNEIFKFLYDPIVAHCSGDYGESVLVKNDVKKIVTFNKVYSRALSCNLIFVILVPIFTSDENMLPEFIRFNVESDHFLILYWMAYVYGSIASFICFIYNFTNLFIWYILYNYAIEYKLLGHRFRSLGTAMPNTYHQDLIRLIRAHCNLFE